MLSVLDFGHSNRHVVVSRLVTFIFKKEDKNHRLLMTISNQKPHVRNERIYKKLKLVQVTFFSFYEPNFPQ